METKEEELGIGARKKRSREEALAGAADPPESGQHAHDEGFWRKLQRQLPEEVRRLSKEEQLRYFHKLVRQFAKQQKLDEQKQEEAKRLHQDYKTFIQQNYQPLHPDIYDLSTWGIHPSLKRLVSEGEESNASPTAEQILSSLTPVSPSTPQEEQAQEQEEERGKGGDETALRVDSPWLYTLEVFEGWWTERLLEELQHFESWCQSKDLSPPRPNSMNRYGVILDDLSFTTTPAAPSDSQIKGKESLSLRLYDTLQQFIQQYINPLVAVVYPHIGASLDSHHGFVVEYAMGKDEQLDHHVDSADVTLNVCLGRRFEGGELVFRGVRCCRHLNTAVSTNETVVLQHSVGRGILHLGKHRHLARAIRSGERTNLILWCRSSSFGNQCGCDGTCPHWCGANYL